MNIPGEFAVGYLAGLACVGTLLTAWFDTPVSVYLFGRMYEGVFTAQELRDVWAVMPPLGSKFLGRLLSCPLCLGTWFSLFVSVCLCVCGGYGDNGWKLIWLCLGWPYLYTLLKTHRS